MKVQLISFRLRRRIHLAAAIVLFAETIHGATITVWKNQGASRTDTNTVTLTMEGERCRIDYSELFSVLLHGDTGDAYQILHPSKLYVRHRLADMQASGPCADSTNARPVATGRLSLIGTNSAREYRVTNACWQQMFWVAPDYPDWQKLADASAPAIARLAGRANVHPGSYSLPGMIVRTETIGILPGFLQTNLSHGGQTTTNQATLLSAKIVSADPAAMAVPPEYREVKAFPTGPPQTNRLVGRLMDEQSARIRQTLSNSNPLASLSIGLHGPTPDWVQAQTFSPERSSMPSSNSTATHPGSNGVGLSLAAWGQPPKTVFITNASTGSSLRAGQGRPNVTESLSMGRIILSTNGIPRAIVPSEQKTNSTTTGRESSGQNDHSGPE